MFSSIVIICLSLINFLVFDLIFVAAVVSQRGGGSRVIVQFQPVIFIGGRRSAGQFRVRSTMRLSVTGIPGRYGPQDEHQSQRRRLRSNAATNGRRRRREQEKLVGFFPLLNLIVICCCLWLLPGPYNTYVMGSFLRVLATCWTTER